MSLSCAAVFLQLSQRFLSENFSSIWNFQIGSQEPSLLLRSRRFLVVPKFKLLLLSTTTTCETLSARRSRDSNHKFSFSSIAAFVISWLRSSNGKFRRRTAVNTKLRPVISVLPRSAVKQMKSDFH